MSQRAAYMMECSVNSMYRETDQTPEIKESYQRSSLIFCEQEIQGDSWRRRLEEYEIDQETLHSREEEQRCSRENLLLHHHRAMDSRKNEFGLNLPLEIEYKKDNTELIAEPDLRFDQIYLPTLFSPSAHFDESIPAVEKDRSTIQLSAGAGIFPLGYYTTREETANGNRIQALIDEHVVQYEMTIFELSMLPSGQIEYLLPTDSLLPQSSAGNYRFIFRAKGENLYGDEVDVVIVDYKIRFSYKKVSIILDEMKY